MNSPVQGTTRLSQTEWERRSLQRWFDRKREMDMDRTAREGMRGPGKSYGGIRRGGAVRMPGGQPIR